MILEHEDLEAVGVITSKNLRLQFFEARNPNCKAFTKWQRRFRTELRLIFSRKGSVYQFSA